jgi:arylsulfatase A-like enzyme
VPAAQVLFTTPLREAGYFTAAAGKWHLGPHVTRQFDRVLDKPPGPAGAEQWVELLRARPKDKPFFLWLAAIDPHRPYGQRAEPRHDPAGVVVPPYLPDTPVVRKDLADYLDEVARLDDHVGAVLDELDAQGVAKGTAVVFLSDNGRPFPRSKTTLYDSGIRTPLLVRLPGRAAAGSASASLVSAVDLAPTVLELAGVAAPDTLQGKSFAPVLADPGAAVREFAFAEHNWHDYRAHERAVRSPRYTFVRNWLPELTGSPPADAVAGPTFQLMRRLHAEGKLTGPQAEPFRAPRPAEELYDTDADPHALHNLAADPAHAEALGRLRQALAEWQAETGDTFDPAAISPDRFDRATGKRLPPAAAGDRAK